MSPDERADKAMRVLLTHSPDADRGDDHLPTAAADLVADLMHLIARHGEDPQGVIDRAVMYFDEEKS